jgi:hypothetical protein
MPLQPTGGTEPALPLRFSPSTEATLRKGGWSPEYQGPSAEYADFLLSRGFVVSDSAVWFFSHFGGLHFRHEYERELGEYDSEGKLVARILSLSTNFHFDLPLAVGISAERVNYDSVRIGKPLCPIGEESGSVLLIAADGMCYSVFDEHVNLMGRDPFEMIEVLCRNEAALRRLRGDLSGWQ